MSNRFFWSGNIAVAEGALRAGLKFYAGYPITPSSDLMEYISKKLPMMGGVFIQGEDEIASINMIIGASIDGAKSMTATSGPGFSLMQEGLGLAIMLEIPIVVVDVMRLGPSTGQATKSGQGDIMQARWGRHGDQSLIVLAASSPYTAYYRAIDAFNLSELLRTPVVLLIDELTAHLWETVLLDKNINVIERRYGGRGERFFDSDDYGEAPPMPRIGEGYNVLYTSSTHNGYGVRKTQDPQTHNRLVRRIHEKIWRNLDKIFRFNVYPRDIDRYEVVIFSYCSTARVARESTELLMGHGIRAIALELETLWPINYEILREYSKQASLLVVPEMNLGQLIYDINVVSNGVEVLAYNKIGGGIPIYPKELAEFILEVLKK